MKNEFNDEFDQAFEPDYFIYFKAFFVLFISGVIGVLVVRLIIFDPVEVFAWELFWMDPFKRGWFTSDEILGSTTFRKSVIGFIIGTGIGTYFTRRWFTTS